VRPVLDEDVGLAAEQSVFPLHQSPLELLKSVSTEDTESRHFIHKSALETGDGLSCRLQRPLSQHKGRQDL
jgi:hypothetical protein